MFTGSAKSEIAFKTDNDTWQSVSSFSLPSVFTEVVVLIKLKSGNSASLRFTDFEFKNVSNGGVIFYAGCFLSGSVNNLGYYLHKTNATTADIKVFENGVNTTSNCLMKFFYK